MINITLPDNSIRQYEAGATALDVARSISEGLARNVVSAEFNGQVIEANRPLNEDGSIKLLTLKDEQGKATFWHSSAHLMAEAIEALYPGTKFGIGPDIEAGYYYDIDLPEGMTLTNADFKRIEDKMLELARTKQQFVRREVTKEEALAYFTAKDDEYKLELINELEDGEISFYQSGSFTDLCRGPHLMDTSQIKAVKVLSVAGAYWRGDESRKMMTRVYGISFPKKKELDAHLEMLEEAKKRDHRRIGKDMGLFTFSQNVGMGLPLWLPKGAEMREGLIQFLTKILRHKGYEMVSTPHIGNVNLYKTSGHYDKYGEDSFQAIDTPHEGEQFMLKPMNCPHHCEIFKAQPHSYKQLPIRMAEFGTVYRYEQHGELHGLTRVRSFTQDDAHVFCREDQVKDEFVSILEIVLYIFKALGFSEFESQISLRHKTDRSKYIGSEDNWNMAEQAIIEAVEEQGLKTRIEYDEAAFYGPKLDFMVKDALGRRWQLGTIQVDYNLPERFQLEYTGSDNLKHRPVMLHRAIFGSMERFMAVLIEHTAGKFPLWLTPEQVKILPVSEKYNNYAQKVSTLLENSDIRAQIDDRNEKVGRKIRDAELERIPFMLIVGEKDEADQTISVRKQGHGDLGAMSIEEFSKIVQAEIDEMLAE